MLEGVFWTVGIYILMLLAECQSASMASQVVYYGHQCLSTCRRLCRYALSIETGCSLSRPRVSTRPDFF